MRHLMTIWIHLRTVKVIGKQDSTTPRSEHEPMASNLHTIVLHTGPLQLPTFPENCDAFSMLKPCQIFKQKQTMLERRLTQFL